MTPGRHLVSSGREGLCLVKSQTSGAASSAGRQASPGGWRPAGPWMQRATVPLVATSPRWIRYTRPR